MRRSAVDSTAKDYWTEYFGDYGKSWVREIPHRVSAALAADVQLEVARRTGARVAGAPPRLVVAPVAPRSWARLADGGMRLEGFARAPNGLTRLFTATFSGDGALRAIESKTLPLSEAA